MRGRQRRAVILTTTMLLGCGGDVSAGDPDAARSFDAPPSIDAALPVDAPADAALPVDAPADAALTADAPADTALTADAPADAALLADASADAAVAVDAGPVRCVPVATTPVIATIGTPVSFALAPLESSSLFAVLLDIDTGVAWTTVRPDGSGAVGRSPLDTGATGAWGLVSVNVPGTDDQIVARWRDDIARVDRHVIPGGSSETRTMDLLRGSLVDRGVGCALGGDALVVHDAQGLGEPINLVLVPRMGSARNLFTNPERRSVDLASRPSGGALLALSGAAPDVTDCLVVPVSAAGVAGATVPVSTDTTCARVAITERTDGVVVVAFIHGASGRAAYQLLDGASLAPMGSIVELGPGLAGRMSASAGAGGTFRITWQDAAGLTSRSFEPGGALRSAECITALGGVYAEHRAAHMGSTTGIALVTSRAVSLAALPD